jgi:hypothetical protein
MEAKKGDVMQIGNALQYLAKFKIADFAAAGEVQNIIKQRGWDKK